MRDDPGFPLYVAARVLANFYRPSLAELGLTDPHYLVLRVHWAQGPLGIKDLGETLSLDSGTLSPLVKRLELTGYVHRQRSRSEGRQVLVSTTEAGDALRVRADALAIEAWQALRYSPEEFDARIRFLNGLTRRLGIPA
ncbi:MarR family transcriptional regulator [Streptomyces sp. PSKA01]|uniref:MarR family transcriptional regulator n=1 Tax=Streptomyces cupreus TaxID=2759956 RepID=A0A7X1JAI1_9ACTN|nr:MarR family transcriptional regulator [Streptomyces cupreus]